MSLMTAKLAQRLLVCVIALLVLLAPACQGLCQSGVCESGKATSETSDCHAGAAHGQDEGQGSSVRAAANCGLRQLTAALPVDSRGLQVRACAMKCELLSDHTMSAARFPLGKPSVHSAEEIRSHSRMAPDRHVASLSTVLRI